MSQDSIREAYDAFPYISGPLFPSHPARTGAVARLLGVKAAFPERARVLEIGCAEGMNLLPLAERFSGGTFLGIDISPKHIAMAERCREAAHLGNARLLCADVREWEPEPGAWDYVIAHGVYSWVPAAVRERLMAVCAKALSPDGVAYISYNVFPGSGLDYGLRQFLQDEARKVADHATRWAYLQQILQTVAAALRNDPSPHAIVRLEIIQQYLAGGPALLFHDQLSEHYTPVTLPQFAEHAGRHGLHYLFPADFGTGHFDMMPPERQQALAVLHPDFPRGQALMDVIYPRRHRMSLLTLHDMGGARRVDHEALRLCAFRLRVPQPVAPGQPLTQIVGLQNLPLPLDTPLRYAIGNALHEAAPSAIPFERLAEIVAPHLPEPGKLGPLMEWLYSAFCLNGVDVLLVEEHGWLSPGGKDQSNLSKALRANGRLPVGPWHELAV